MIENDGEAGTASAKSSRPQLIGADLADVFRTWGEPSFRYQQLARWIYGEYIFDPLSMRDLPRRLRQKLMDEIEPFPLALVDERSADRAQTSKALFRLADGSLIESVLMRYPATARGRARRTVCVSSQVGCAVGCPFCATGLLGFKRHLTAAEIVSQVLFFAGRARQLEGSDSRITNVVLMGEGEPLANFREVWSAVELLHDPDAVGLGARRVTISTSGLAPGIRELAERRLPVGLAVSLHAPTDDLRDRLVPINRKYPIADLLQACQAYILATGRRVSFEYAMMREINDGVEQAVALAQLLDGMLAHVNLIPLNLVDGSPFLPTARPEINAFQRALQGRGVSCTVRATRGDVIDGA
ncbi:MAG TPA: 23S rRNA (adenine(2503)-C(2))-methyltransferase RlmN, partial [Chloroflexota bacterium]|nr:23S rRNA (adenine(2503)-C(2))-methyltransferase RlmN [Chloroflexota bacterium]